MASLDEMKQTSMRLNQFLSGQSGIVSVGASTENGAPILVVYVVQRSKRAQAKIPQVWEGFPVRVRIMGIVRPL